MGTENNRYEFAIKNEEPNITMSAAFARMQDSIKQLGKRLAEATFSTVAFTQAVDGANTNECSDTPDKILSGEFWDEIERNNIFLQNLK